MTKRLTFSCLLSVCIHALVWYVLFFNMAKNEQAPPKKLSLAHLKVIPSPIQNQAPSLENNPTPQPQHKPSSTHVDKQPAAGVQKKQQRPQMPTKAPPSFYQLEKEMTYTPLQELYGNDFYNLSKEDKKYLDENYRKIYEITQRNLRYPQQAGRLGLEGSNRLEFYLYPNGDIRDLRLIHSSGYEMFDKNSIYTIEISYKDYPKPQKPIKIIFDIHYLIGR